MSDNNSKEIIRTEKDGIEFFTIVATGESGLSQRGLARACGVSHTAIQKIEKDLATKSPAKWLQAFTGQDIYLATKSVKSGKRGSSVRPYNAKFCVCVIQYFAFNGKESAQETLMAIGEIGINSFIQGVTGWLPEKYQSNPEARNRILSQKQKKTHPLFGDENMNKVASFLKVGRSHPKLANWMWAYIYCTFSQEEICKLNSRNPVQPNGHRKDCVYEWLDENSTQKHKEHFDKVLTLVQISTSEQEFANMFNRMFNQAYQQELLKTQPF
jgi:hypothetical protein